jgi:fructose-bisphosphate aldolase class II
MRGEPRLDFDRLAAINAEIGIPLVIHGGTGLGDDQFRRLIANGVAKINYYTALADAAGVAIRLNAAEPDRNSYTDLTKGVQPAIQAEVERCIALWGGANRADALLEACRPWQEVEHLVIYNSGADDPAQTTAMMAEGRRVLAAIPGVRQVITGTSVREDDRYRHCWLVRFASPAVIDAYRDHPDHQAFANDHFRPVAADRLTIDYRHES